MLALVTAYGAGHADCERTLGEQGRDRQMIVQTLNTKYGGQGITFEILYGADMSQATALVSQFRIEHFKTYPYLYVGNMDYEAEYIAGFAGDPKSMLVLAKHEGQVVAVSTAMPLVTPADILRDTEKAFKSADRDPKDFYYFGEVIVHPDFRKKGLTRAIYAAQELAAKDMGFSGVCFLTVERDEKDPRKPEGYVSSDVVFRALGYAKLPITINYHWPTIGLDGTVRDIDNPLSFWYRKL